MYSSRKIQKDDSQNLTFNGCNVGSSTLERHLGLLLDEKLKFDEHIQTKISKCNKRIGIDNALLTIYKCFIRPHLTMQTLYTTNLTMIHSPRKLRIFNIEHVEK